MTGIRRPSGWRDWLVLLLAAVLIIGGPLGAVYLFRQHEQQASLERRVEVVEQQRDAAAADAGAKGSALNEANEDRVAQGQDPIVPTATPSSIPGAPGAQGVPGPGPSAAQVRQAVRDVLAGNPSLTEVSTTSLALQVAAYLRANPPADGVDGADGADGKAPTDAQIASAVARYLVANSPAAGKDGAAGRAPTAEEIQAAVGAYLEANPGPPGPQGEPGVPGAAGANGSDGQAGQPPLSWTTTRADGTVETCSRDENFDATAPMYVCRVNGVVVPTSDPTTDPEPSETSPAEQVPTETMTP